MRKNCIQIRAHELTTSRDNDFPEEIVSKHHPGPPQRDELLMQLDHLRAALHDLPSERERVQTLACSKQRIPRPHTNARRELRVALRTQVYCDRWSGALDLGLREVEGAPGDCRRIVPAAGQEMRLTEVGQEERMVDGARRLGVSERLFYEVTPSRTRPNSAYAHPRCAAVMSKRTRTSAARHTSTARSSGGMASGMAPRRRETKPRLR